MGSKSSSPPPPDYSGIAAANAQSAQYAKEAADNDLAFRKQTYADSQPQQKALADMATKVGNQQYDMGVKAMDQADFQWGRYKDKGIPLEDTMAKEAADYGGAADQGLQAGRAISDVRQQAGLARGVQQRNLTSMGVNPNSGRFASMGRQSTMQEAGMAAGGANQARIASRDKGIGLRASAAAYFANKPASAASFMALGQNAGTGAVGNQNTGFMSGLPYAQYASGGVAGQQNAAKIGIDANYGLGGLMNTGYATASNNANEKAGGTMGLIGAGIGAAATIY